ncbi:MAG: vWA domain-containing protein [Myxococcota bacterium]
MKALGMLACGLCLGCGARTGLPLPDGGGPAPRDGGMDAPAVTDGATCEPTRLGLRQPGAQVLFALDRSASMASNLQGVTPLPGEPSRWELVVDALQQVLVDADPLLRFGATLYPDVEPGDSGPQALCNVDPGIDLPPGPNNESTLNDLLASSTDPNGGTPTAVALREVRDFFEANPAASDTPRNVVLATDGAPNCNPDTGVHRSRCVCTSERSFCLDPMVGDYNCLDEDRTVAEIEGLFMDLGIPVYVVGIENPARPDLGDVLDRMADAGGRPRDEPGERRFYDVQEPGDLQAAFASITDGIARCTFTVQRTPTDDAAVEVRVAREPVPRDPVDGWDFTADDRSEITLFGSACERASAGGVRVTARETCPDGG